MRYLYVPLAVCLLGMLLSSRVTAVQREPSDLMEVQIEMDFNGEHDIDPQPLSRKRRQTKNKNDKNTTPVPMNKQPTTKSPEETRKKMNMKITDTSGKEQTIMMEQVKEMTPKAEMLTVRNGRIEIDNTAMKKLEVYSDYVNDTGSVLVMACDDSGDNCLSMGSFYNGVESLLIQPFNSTPYATKGKKAKEILTAVGDGRVMGVAADGSTLGVPTSSRKKRDINLLPRMRKNMRRLKRQAVTSHVVELVVVVDSSEYSYWLNRSEDVAAAKEAMQLYFILMTNMMDERYQSIYDLKGDVDISFMLNAIVFIESPTDDPWEEDNVISDGVLDADKMLDDVTTWAWLHRAEFPSHDHVMVVSNLDLAAKDDNGVYKTSTLGVAWSGAMCNAGYSVSIIEDAGLGLVDYVATHEVGHSLSSTHDSRAGCDDADFFVMGTMGGSPSEGLFGTGAESNPWIFSTCATDSIYSFVTGLGSGSCLLTSTYNQDEYNVYKSYVAPGVLIPIDTQCELQFGPGSRRCFALDASICSDGAYCWNPADPGFCYTLYVRQGTLCGDQLRCNHGLCENSTIVMPTCPPESNTFLPPGDVVVGSDIKTTVSPPTSAAATKYATVPDSGVDLMC